MDKKELEKRTKKFETVKMSVPPGNRRGLNPRRT
jgi:hypothetical protein